jgi:hypothetical protein
MYRSVNASQALQIGKSKQNETQTSAMAVHCVFEGRLSFLSLKHAFDGYPDTGESGDAYDIEASIER